MNHARGRRGRAAVLLGAVATATLSVSPASASVPHTVQPGETLSGVAAANGLTTQAVAAYNGMSDEALLIAGDTIQIPSADETTTSSASTASSTAASSSGSGHTVTSGESLWSLAAAYGVDEASLAAANGLSPDAMLIIGQTVQIPGASASSSSTVSDSGVSLGSIYSPSGTAYLRSDAASSWNSMRQESLNDYGVDLYPEGPLGAYRTYDQQAQLYQDYLNGVGAPANPPGSSAHEQGTAIDLAGEDMRSVVDQIGSGFGWAKTEAPTEWWHVNYLGW